MKQSLQLKLSQHLTLTPQLQQSIRLLQLSTVELNQELERYLNENPLLERTELAGESGEAAPPVPQTGSEPSEGPSTTESTHNDEAQSFADDSYSSSPRRDADDRDDFTQIAENEPSLQEHLMSQLRLTGISERDRQVVTLLIAHLDEEGYLKQDLDELHAAVSAEIPLDRDELSIALRNLQNLEPTGVGARDVCECLALQLRALPADTPYREEAVKLVTQHLNVLASRDYPRLKRLLGVNDEELKELRDLILSLDPKPGRAFGQGDTRYVVPDVLVRKVNSRWVATLNREAMPRLRINKMYADILQGSRDSNAKHLAGQLQEARWLIKNVQQRFDTILRVTQAIVDRQKHFFEHGEVAMRPLVLREIAEAVGLHESTISRVTTQKYMLTARGIFELKYFFGSHVSTDAGGACSSTAIRALIKQLVAAEDGKKPLSDHRISDLLAQQGIQVARRTVAKYREAMQIQPANLRKSI
jgi:RNA polymerase sigma-54 factor